MVLVFGFDFEGFFPVARVSDIGRSSPQSGDIGGRSMDRCKKVNARSNDDDDDDDDEGGQRKTTTRCNLSFFSHADDATTQPNVSTSVEVTEAR